jgi:agmatinase
MALQGVSFADANASFDDAQFVIIGIPFDRTSSYRSGARFAPNAIREASYNFETFLFEHEVDLLEIPFHDMGNLEEQSTVDEMVSAAQGIIGEVVEGGKFPLIMGGEHSVTIPAVRTFRDIGFISIDAHLDFRREYLGQKNSHACVTRRITEQLGLDRVTVMGVRSMSSDEWEEEKPLFYDAFTLRRRGVRGCLDEAIRAMAAERIYLSLDIDGIDPAFAPGTGTPEPFGMDPTEVKTIISGLGDRLVGFDVVEVCPPYDRGNTAALAARLMREVIAVVHKHKK